MGNGHIIGLFAFLIEMFRLHATTFNKNLLPRRIYMKHHTFIHVKVKSRMEFRHLKSILRQESNKPWGKGHLNQDGNIIIINGAD